MLDYKINRRGQCVVSSPKGYSFKSMLALLMLFVVGGLFLYRDASNKLLVDCKTNGDSYTCSISSNEPREIAKTCRRVLSKDHRTSCDLIPKTQHRRSFSGIQTAEIKSIDESTALYHPIFTTSDKHEISLLYEFDGNFNKIKAIVTDLQGHLAMKTDFTYRYQDEDALVLGILCAVIFGIMVLAFILWPNPKYLVIDPVAGTITNELETRSIFDITGIQYVHRKDADKYYLDFYMEKAKTERLSSRQKYYMANATREVKSREFWIQINFKSKYPMILVTDTDDFNDEAVMNAIGKFLQVPVNQKPPSNN